MALCKAEEKDRALIENLFNLYRNDLSRYNGDFQYLDAQGYFEYGAADELLPFGDGVETYIITDRTHPVGLVIVTGQAYALEGCLWRFQELYLIRPARGRGLAREACAQLLKQKPGRWCLSVYRDNDAARRFWDGLIAQCGEPVSEAGGEEGMTDLVFDTKITR